MKFHQALKHMENGRIGLHDDSRYRVLDDKLQVASHSGGWCEPIFDINDYMTDNWELAPKTCIRAKYCVAYINQSNKLQLTTTKEYHHGPLSLKLDPVLADAKDILGHERISETEKEFEI